MASLNEKIIVKTGIKLIKQKRKLTFSSIGHALNVHSQALYSYFKNQDELNWLIVDTIIKKIIAACQKQVFGKAGKEAIIVFVQTIRELAIRNPELARFTLNLMRNDSNLLTQNSFVRLRDLLHILIKTVYPDEEKQLLASRTLRDLLVGDIYNNINGWFSNPRIRSDESFVKMLDSVFIWLSKKRSA